MAYWKVAENGRIHAELAIAGDFYVNFPAKISESQHYFGKRWKGRQWKKESVQALQKSG
jgi:hypothetical protein